MLAVGALLIGMLAHETAIIYGAPLLLLTIAHDEQHGILHRAAALQLAGMLVAGVVLILLAQLMFSQPPSAIASHMLAATPKLLNNPEHRLWRDIAIYMAVSGPEGIRTAICGNLNADPQYLPMAVGSVAVLFAYSIVLPRLRGYPLAAAVATLLPLIFMLAIANDTGRWLKLSVLNAWLLHSFYLIREPSREGVSASQIVCSFAVLAVLLLMGPTQYRKVNRSVHTAAMRAGAADPAPFRVWMDGCAPGWQTLVYGRGFVANGP